jgi:hypothetical protein
MLTNPLLQRALEGVEQGVTSRETHDKVVRAGMKAIYAESTFQKLTAALDRGGDIVDQAAKAAILIMAGLQEKSRGTLQPPDMITGGMALMLDILDFLDSAGTIQVDNATLEQATKTYLNELLPKFGLTPQKMDEVLGSVQETLSNPERMAQYQQSLKGGSDGAA